MPEKTVEVLNVGFKSEKEEKLSSDIHSYCTFSKITLKNVNRFIQYMEGSNPLIMYIRARQMCVYPRLIVDNLEKIKENDEMLEDCEIKDVSTKSKIDAIVAHIKKQNKEEKKNNILSLQKRNRLFL